MSNWNDDQNKVKTKEKLLELLNGYKGILTKTILDYLKSLIELEFSVIREYISDSDRKALAELDLYKQVAIYNIYNGVQKLINQQKGEFIIYGNNKVKHLIISTRLNDRDIKLFDFDYKELHSDGWNIPKVPSGFKTLKIGDISLFQSIENKELREAELDRVMKILQILYDKRNPYSSSRGLIGGPGADWLFEHEMEIEKYEKLFNKLDSKKELNDEDKKEIEITNQIHDLLLEEFGLTNESFVDENNQTFANLSKDKTNLKKTLVKKMPNLTITNNISYI